LAKDGVAEGLVKGEGLKVEGVAMRVEATPGMRLVLRFPHETTADAVAPKSLGHPKLLDEEPVPVRVANQSANKLSVETGEDYQVVISLRCRTAIIEADQFPHDLLTVLGGAMFSDAGVDFVHGRREESSNFKSVSDGARGAVSGSAASPSLDTTPCALRAFELPSQLDEDGEESVMHPN
jgi:hypothetical protein